MLREHKIKKTYAAVVKGVVSLDKQLIDAPLHRYELANGERRVRVSSEGRTHQIRVHGLSIGHPLVGDDKYGHETEYKGPKPRRLCLHAMRLDIPGYAPIEAPLPEDMQSIVAQLRAQKKD
ncbi:unnamed protein product [Notodromas monacha]|uniref:Pseudouridine synthase RsuA/RluA-like domain-containing protein n=1 Tax=Notodromas monacha TaxID=399045 RepID=A0A7R9C3L0_9CRUS|nr:unnamed protein product [Notodromas monacha]CAG0926304.1 unnamed protein product [Notodromas monacha]